ncbi:MAG: tyrosine-protein phosphatase [Pseudomonadota bacterium]
MIDIHCHVLFDADDGAEDLDMSLAMCRLAAEDGIKEIIATPHFIVGDRNEKQVKDKVRLLNEELVRKNIDIRIYPGNEIFIDIDMASRLSSGECLSLNGSRYVLVEFPMLEMPRYSSDALYELKLKGYIPIIAHPERNKYIQQNAEYVYQLVSEGCLMQVNSSSIIGHSGDEARKLALQLVNHDMVHFIASDSHSTGRRRTMLSASRRVLSEACRIDRLDELYFDNARRVLDNQSLDIAEPIPIKRKKSLFQIIGLKK